MLSPEDEEADASFSGIASAPESGTSADTFLLRVPVRDIVTGVQSDRKGVAVPCLPKDTVSALKASEVSCSVPL